MNKEKFNELTDEVVSVIDFDRFSKQVTADRLELNQEFIESFSEDEILRIKVVREAINSLPEAELLVVFEILGIDLKKLPVMKRIYNKPFKQA